MNPYDYKPIAPVFLVELGEGRRGILAVGTADEPEAYEDNLAPEVFESEGLRVKPSESGKSRRRLAYELEPLRGPPGRLAVLTACRGGNGDQQQ